MIYDKVVFLFIFAVFSILVYTSSLWEFRNTEKVWSIFKGLLSNIFGGFLTFFVIAIFVFSQGGGGFGWPLVFWGSLLISLVNQLIASHLFKRKGNAWAILGVWLIYPLAIVSLYALQ